MRVVTIARKSLEGNLAQNTLAHRAGALNIDGCRIPRGDDYLEKCSSVVNLDSNHQGSCYMGFQEVRQNSWSPQGAWPYNLLLLHTEACQKREEEWVCVPSCACSGLARQAPDAAKFFWSGHERDLLPYLEKLIEPPSGSPTGIVHTSACTGELVSQWAAELCPGAHVLVLSETGIEEACLLEDAGFEIRDTILIVNSLEFHYVPKASRRERDAGVPALGNDLRVIRYFPTSDEVECGKDGLELSEVPGDLAEHFAPREVRIPRRHHNYHSTVKPIEILERLMDTPVGGRVLDPFVGSGTTLLAAIRCRNRVAVAIGVELDEQEGYVKIADARVRHHATSEVEFVSPVGQALCVGLPWETE